MPFPATCRASTCSSGSIRPGELPSPGLGRRCAPGPSGRVSGSSRGWPSGTTPNRSWISRSYQNAAPDPRGHRRISGHARWDNRFHGLQVTVGGQVGGKKQGATSWLGCLAAIRRPVAGGAPGGIRERVAGRERGAEQPGEPRTGGHPRRERRRPATTPAPGRSRWAPPSSQPPQFGGATGEQLGEVERGMHAEQDQHSDTGHDRDHHPGARLASRQPFGRGIEEHPVGRQRQAEKGHRNRR